MHQVGQGEAEAFEVCPGRWPLRWAKDFLPVARSTEQGLVAREAEIWERVQGAA